jgi:hypothetical protein
MVLSLPEISSHLSSCSLTAFYHGDLGTSNSVWSTSVVEILQVTLRRTLLLLIPATLGGFALVCVLASGSRGAAGAARSSSLPWVAQSACTRNEGKGRQGSNLIDKDFEIGNNPVVGEDVLGWGTKMEERSQAKAKYPVGLPNPACTRPGCARGSQEYEPPQARAAHDESGVLCIASLRSGAKNQDWLLAEVVGSYKRPACDALVSWHLPECA